MNTVLGEDEAETAGIAEMDNTASLGSNNGANQFFSGSVDDVRVYNRALTPDEIKRLYKMGSTAKTGVASSNGSLSSGLVGWWTFDGKDTSTNASGLATVLDRSGNGKKASSPATANTPTLINGKMGQAMRFDGQDDYIDAGIITAILGVSEMTVSAWARTATSSKLDGEERHIVDQSQCVAGDGSFDLFSDPGAENEGKMRALFMKNGGGGSVTALTQTRIDDGNWHHVLATYKNGRESLIYFDGTKTTGGDVGDDILDTDGFDLEIGGDCNGNSSPYRWKGDIDDVRLYNGSVTDEEVKRFYNMGR
jgi:hypothetical protein